MKYQNNSFFLEMMKRCKFSQNEKSEWIQLLTSSFSFFFSSFFVKCVFFAVKLWIGHFVKIQKKNVLTCIYVLEHPFFSSVLTRNIIFSRGVWKDPLGVNQTSTHVLCFHLMEPFDHIFFSKNCILLLYIILLIHFLSTNLFYFPNIFFFFNPLFIQIEFLPIYFSF